MERNVRMETRPNKNKRQRYAKIEPSTVCSFPVEELVHEGKLTEEQKLIVPWLKSQIK